MMPRKRPIQGAVCSWAKAGPTTPLGCCFASSFSVLRFPIGRDFIFPKFSFIRSKLFLSIFLIFSLQNEISSERDKTTERRRAGRRRLGGERKFFRFLRPRRSLGHLVFDTGKTKENCLIIITLGSGSSGSTGNRPRRGLKKTDHGILASFWISLTILALFWEV